MSPLFNVSKPAVIFYHDYRYGCDLVYTPMIVSDSFVKSVKARDMEFSTNSGILRKSSVVKSTACVVLCWRRVKWWIGNNAIF